MALESFADAHHHAYIKGFGMVAESVTAGYVHRTGGVTSVVSHSPVALFNQIIIHDDTATERDMETAVAAMGGTGLRFAVSLRSEADSRFVPILEESGLILAESAIPAMVMQPIPDHQMPTELEILSGSTTLDDHIYVASKGFGIPEEMLETVLVPAMARRPDATFYAGYVDDQPVSTSIGFIDEGSVSVFNVATLEDLRGRGYGAALTMKAVIDARNQGCEVAFLQSSELGYTVYTRLGFATIFTYDLWGLPPVE
ncbi:MAG: GNAT family N-acetyltransferase [Acidobacteria bacterium]|nr:GNAT family N-acetyltransferase [Acidobacteriota bacterium]